MENLVLVGAGIIALVIAIVLIKYLFVGAFFLFSWASEQGFIGVAAILCVLDFSFPLYVNR